jgi:hypothetical protein
VSGGRGHDVVSGNTFESLSGGPHVSEGSHALLDSRAHDDVHARRLLQCAQGAIQKWPEGFVGFFATIRCRDGQEEIAGDVRVFAGGRVELRLPHEALSAWAEGTLSAIALARTPRFFRDGDGQFPITFEPDDDHPLGRGVRVHLGAPARRTYRIDPKGRIRQQENAEPTTQATARYDGLVRTCPGRILPTRIHILEWDVRMQTAIQTAEIEDAYDCQDHVWLPVCRRATVARGAARRELVLELSRHVRL